MKKPLSVIVLFFGLVIANVIIPMKLKFASLPLALISGLVFCLVFLMLHPILKSFTKGIIFYSEFTSKQSFPYLPIGYIGFLTGLYFSYNYSVTSTFLDINYSPKIKNIYLLSSIGSCITYTGLTIFENIQKCREKYKIVYSENWDREELFLSGLSNMIISEFIGICTGFYSTMLMLFYKFLQYLFVDIPIKLMVFLIILLLASLILGLIAHRLYKKKAKNIKA